MKQTLALLSLLLALSGACAPEHDMQGDGGSPGASGAEADCEGGTFHVRYTPQPDPIPLNEPFDLALEVTKAADGAALSDAATVDVDAAMPAHGHGMNTTPEVTRNADGTWAVDGMQFHMPGDWELYVDVADQGVTERCTFPVTMTE